MRVIGNNEVQAVSGGLIDWVTSWFYTPPPSDVWMTVTSGDLQKMAYMAVGVGIGWYLGSSSQRQKAYVSALEHKIAEQNKVALQPAR